jgi:glycosyltransferase involved in cell wall biosynthesis
MRVIHVTNNAESVDVGIEREATNLAVAQQANGFEVMLAIDRPGVFAGICEEHEIPVIVHDGLGQQPRSQRGGRTGDESAIHEFMALLEIHKPDIIHSHSSRAGHIAIPAGNQAGIPCVVTADNPLASIESYRKGLRFTVICLTETSFNKLQRDMPDIESYYIPNGTKVAPPVPAQTPNGDHSVNLVLVGSLTYRKACDVAIMAMVELRRRLGSDCPVLNIYGDGPRREYLTEMVSVLELNDHVRFHGFKPQVLEHCPSTDMLIMPSRQEVGPLVVSEAMSRGIPVVATDVGSVRNMLPDERYGRVVPADCMRPLAEAIESLLLDVAGGQFNPDLPIERHRSLFSFETWVERIEAVYEQLLQPAH